MNPATRPMKKFKFDYADQGWEKIGNEYQGVLTKVTTGDNRMVRPIPMYSKTKSRKQFNAYGLSLIAGSQ